VKPSFLRICSLSRLFPRPRAPVHYNPASRPSAAALESDTQIILALLDAFKTTCPNRWVSRGAWKRMLMHADAVMRRLRCRSGWSGVDYQRKLRGVRPPVRYRLSPRYLAATSFDNRQDWPNDVEQHDTGAVPHARRTTRECASHHFTSRSAVSRCRLRLRDYGIASLF